MGDNNTSRPSSSNTLGGKTPNMSTKPNTSMKLPYHSVVPMTEDKTQNTLSQMYASLLSEALPQPVNSLRNETQNTLLAMYPSMPTAALPSPAANTLKAKTQKTLLSQRTPMSTD
eukprot:467428-Amphidinium_carterae.1